MNNTVEDLEKIISCLLCILRVHDKYDMYEEISKLMDFYDLDHTYEKFLIDYKKMFD
jgi:hypothetical protein